MAKKGMNPWLVIVIFIIGGLAFFRWLEKKDSIY